MAHNFFRHIIFSCTLIACIGCTDAKRAKLDGLGSKYKVEVLSGGQVVRTYISTGKVSSEKKSDGYYFMDSQTGKLVEISGQVIITALE
jgi:hypothetical protein